MRNPKFSVVGLIVGALLALLVFAVGTAITEFENERLVWGIVAVLVWGACTFGWRDRVVP